MAYSQKYGRTFHFPFSPGTTSDDRVNNNYWQDISNINGLIHTEKLDGENNCLNKYGVFARSHAAPSASPWTGQLRQTWAQIKSSLGNYEIFGENLFAIHSIEYHALDAHFYVFGVRELDKWLSWEETCFIAAVYGLPTVPVLQTTAMLPARAVFEKEVLSLVAHSSVFNSHDVADGKPCSMEGLVTRNINEYGVDEFQQNVFKYVRKGHVKTDEHWTRNWKRSPLQNERK